MEDECGRLLELMPDLRGEVHNWWIEGEVVVVDMLLLATIGGRQLRIPVTDRLTVDDGGRIAARRATFDPKPAIRVLVTTPALWSRWWNSGVAPCVWRRRVIERKRRS